MNNSKKFIAGMSALAIAVCSVPACIFAEETAPSTSVVVQEGFESENHGFTARENQSTVKIVNDGTAHGGDGYLLCTDRKKSWHGPQFLLDETFIAGKEYIASAWVKTPWYGTVTMSMQYTDSSGTAHYTNLKSAISQGDWAEIADVKFSVPKNATGIYIYFECSDANVDIAVDDFTITTAPVYQIQEDIPSLKNVYSPYFKFGGAVMASELANESTVNLIKKHYGSITFGNELKPENVLDKAACLEMAANGDDTNPQVTIDSARELLDFCRDNNIPVRGHVLVWHSQTPDWFFKENYADDGEFVSKEVMLKRMENYIKNLMELLEKDYSDVDFYAWDVVNEIWLDDGKPRQPGEQGSSGSNNSAWVKVFGDNSFVDYAFEYARKYAPEGCKLYYNDFNEYMPSKTAAIVDMATRLKEKGLIDGIGMQSHLDVSFPSVSAYEKALKAFSETGLDIQITELDATTSDVSEAGFEKQAQYYSDIMDLAVKYSDSISAVIIWGTTDDKSWRAAKCPVLFNEDFTAKPCFYSIVDGLEENPEVTTTEPVVTEAPEVTTASDTEITSVSESIDDTRTSQLVVVKMSDDTISCRDMNGKDVTITIPDDQKGTLENIEAGDTIIIGYDDDLTKPLWIDLLKKAETTIETETTEVLTTENPDATESTTSVSGGNSELPEPTLLGDVNADGSVDIVDVTALKQSILKLTELTPEQSANANVIKDDEPAGTIDVKDLGQLIKYIIKVIDKF